MLRVTARAWDDDAKTPAHSDLRAPYKQCHGKLACPQDGARAPGRRL